MSLNKKNRCLQEETIQHFLDGVLSLEKEKEVSQHIAGCEPCRSLLEERKLLIHQLKNALNEIDEDKIEIPDFSPDGTKTESGKTKLYYWWSAAAIFIMLVSIYVVQQNKQPDPELSYVFQEVVTEIDANKPWHEQRSFIHILNEKGEIIDQIENF